MLSSYQYGAEWLSNWLRPTGASAMPPPGVTVYGADLRFECENCQLDGFSFLEGCCPLCIYEGVYTYIITYFFVKRRKNVGSVGCVGQTEKSPQKASREVFQITYTNYTNYITRRNTAVCQTIHGPMDRLNE